MIHFKYPKHVTYCAAKFARTGMGHREMLEVLAKEPIIDDDCIIESVPAGQLPDFVEGPEDRAYLAELLESTGLVGAGRVFESPIDVNPYEHLGFERVMATGPNHYVYRRERVTYCSLGYTFTSYGVKVNALFISFLMSLDTESDIDLIWFVTTTDKGVNPAFDILYDARFQEYIIKIGRDFQARFVDHNEDIPPAESLLLSVKPEPEPVYSTDPVDVIYGEYFGDVRLDAAMSQGQDKEQWRIATYADEVDMAFRRWLVKPNSNLRRTYKFASLLFKHAQDKAPELLGEVYGGLRKQLIDWEFYEFIPRFEKGCAKMKKRYGV
ncbi:hypothetical protein GCM10027299_28840 [Larkinella ripae]